MTYQGKVCNGVVVFEGEQKPPEGARVVVEMDKASSLADGGSSLRDTLLKFAGTVRGMPADGARNHDHYIYGTPKRD